MYERELPQKLPEGFRWIRIPVSEREYERLAYDGILTAEGTARAAFRLKAGMTERPWGLQKALKALVKSMTRTPVDNEGYTDDTDTVGYM
jgi:hypothetical protein